MIVALNLSLNSLGLERQALQMLYLFPVRPRDVFWGKNLTVGARLLTCRCQARSTFLRTIIITTMLGKAG